MEKTITYQDLKAAKLIIDKGLEKACESMSFFMHEKITHHISDFEMELSNKLKRNDEGKEAKITLLVTDLMGELKGSCYLILSEEETDELIKVALPEEIRNDPAKLATMKDAILLEVDNIISASTISIFSNLLKFKMFGGVPRILYVTSDELKDIISDSSVTDKLLLSFKTEFHSSKTDFQPEFLWSLEPKFFEGVKKYVSEANFA
jgi:chemotaxis protein CheY-P-specific phosphatase CheC